MKIIHTLSLISFFFINSLFSQSSCTEALEITDFGIYTVPSINGQLPDLRCFSSNSQRLSNANWYHIRPSENMNIRVSTSLGQNSGRDTRLSIYSGSCNNLSCLVTDDDGGSGYTSFVETALEANVDYYIVFDNNWENTGFDFEITRVDLVSGRLNFTVQTIDLNSSYKKAAVDMNGDFLDDIVGIGGNAITILFQNENGGFTSSTVETDNISHYPSWSIAAGDIDANGKNDLILGGGTGATFLLSNEDNSAYSVMNPSIYIFCQRTNFVDINNDGNLDVFSCHDVDPNVYFINDGNGGLVPHNSGLGFDAGGNYGSIWTDYDNDGDQDLFIAKCRGSNQELSKDELWRNNGNGSFTDVALEANVQNATQSWSSAWGDYDNDGDMDLFSGANSLSTGGHKLLSNENNGTFRDVTGTSLINQTYGSREFVTFDFDNDGFLDIFNSSGSFYMNNGDMTFEELYTAFGFGSIADLNHDGFLDIQTGTSLKMNVPNNNHWLVINTVGTASNRNGIGARVEIYGDWGIQIRDVRSGEGFGFMHTLNTHFGLGAHTTVDSLVVRWPSGIVDQYYNISPDQRFVVTEGQTLSVSDVPIQDLDISLTPIPVKNILYVKGESIIEKLKLYGLNGALLKEIQQPNITEVDVSDIPAGSYIIQIQSAEGLNKTFKILKE